MAQAKNSSSTVNPVDIPHATYSSMIIQAGASSTTAYPVLFEYVDDEYGIYRKSSVVTIDIATPAVINWATHGLAEGAAVVFTTDGALPTGLNAFAASTSSTTNVNVTYYVIAAGLGTNSFQVSSAIGGAAVNTSGSQSGVHTCACISRFYVPESCDYLISISGLVDTTTNSAANCDLWFDVNGTNVVRSNTVAAVDSSGVQAVVAVPLYLDLTAGQYVRLFARFSSANVRLLAVAATANPTRPQCPSMIISAQKVSL